MNQCGVWGCPTISGRIPTPKPIKCKLPFSGHPHLQKKQFAFISALADFVLNCIVDYSWVDFQIIIFLKWKTGLTKPNIHTGLAVWLVITSNVAQGPQSDKTGLSKMPRLCWTRLVFSVFSQLSTSQNRHGQWERISTSGWCYTYFSETSVVIMIIT